MFDFLSRSFSSLFSLFSGAQALTQETVLEFSNTVREALLGADVPLSVADAFVEEVARDLVGMKPPKKVNPEEYYMKIVYDRLVAFLGGVEGVTDPLSKYSSFVVMGLQGSGKTTTIAKLAAYIKNKKPNARILLSSVDFQRPAAVDQLEILAARVGVDFFRASSVDAVSAAREVVLYRKDAGYDYLFLDTAGRLHVDEALLEELDSVVRLVARPYCLLVLDSMTGQESLRVARSFDDKVGFDGAVLSKTDSDTRGGAAFAFRYALKKPIVFVGSGERIEDLERFHPDRVGSRILGMGDIATLVERANEKIKEDENDRMMRALRTGNFTLDDFIRQIDMINKMGSFGSILKYMPGAAQFQISPEQIAQGEREMRRFKAIIQSMTKKERLMPELIVGSRKQRVAVGAGVKIEDVSHMLARFEEGRRLFKQLQGGRGLFR
ncbi:MAG: Signal recognition particle protein [candidate division TM6 bacterium GW2011_GWF2_43_17]|nr:MAG: Signal recognition particle protein [candidate division TM6 bacterium GW2011_GWF2_43_17]HAU30165.1 signal recognition particle protein [Candidatus Dependentiae bacterium]